jgi:hypothetical protein
VAHSFAAFGALDARLIRGKTEHNNRFPRLHDKVTVRQADASAVLYMIDALVRNTGVSIVPSGNVWLCNNWLIDPIQTNPGGDGLVVFIGLAAPVKTPLIGLPQQP